MGFSSLIKKAAKAGKKDFTTNARKRARQERKRLKKQKLSNTSMGERVVIKSKHVAHKTKSLFW